VKIRDIEVFQVEGGLFHLPAEPGLGLRLNEAELAKRRVAVG